MNTAYKLFYCLSSYTRVNAKLGFGKTSFVNTDVVSSQLSQYAGHAVPRMQQ